MQIYLSRDPWIDSSLIWRPLVLMGYLLPDADLVFSHRTSYKSNAPTSMPNQTESGIPDEVNVCLRLSNRFAGRQGLLLSTQHSRNVIRQRARGFILPSIWIGSSYSIFLGSNCGKLYLVLIAGDSRTASLVGMPSGRLLLSMQGWGMAEYLEWVGGDAIVDAEAKIRLVSQQKLSSGENQFVVYFSV